MRCCAWPFPALLEIGSGKGDFIDYAHEIAARYADFDFKASGMDIEREMPVAAFQIVDTFAPWCFQSSTFA